MGTQKPAKGELLCTKVAGPRHPRHPRHSDDDFTTLFSPFQLWWPSDCVLNAWGCQCLVSALTFVLNSIMLISPLLLQPLISYFYSHNCYPYQSRGMKITELFKNILLSNIDPMTAWTGNFFQSLTLIQPHLNHCIFCHPS